jgi:hypothetical protein
MRASRPLVAATVLLAGTGVYQDVAIFMGTLSGDNMDHSARVPIAAASASVSTHISGPYISYIVNPVTGDDVGIPAIDKPRPTQT